jgi:dipeptidyl aminopeptidase/acylaminoacyl peptidase
MLAIKAQAFPSTAALDADAERAKQRKEAGVSALLFDSFPIRHWDHELGPRQPRLYRLQTADGGAAEPEDPVPDAGQALQEAEVALSPDGATLVTTWWRDAGAAFREVDLVAIGPGGRRTLGTGADFGAPAVSPDGRFVVAVREERGTPERAVDLTLWLIDLDTGEGRDLLPGFDLWPGPPVWSHDAGAVYFVADERGHAPVFRVDVGTGEVARLTTEGCFSAPCPAPGGGVVFALCSSFRSPSEVVRIDPGGAVTGLPTPGLPLDLPGVVDEVWGRADDGTELRAWLVRPQQLTAARPAPLLLWVHGGPLSSWNAWSWRWCPHLLVERGYAVLLPDPALSTGYGHAFVQRSWGAWGEHAYTDLMAITDAALEREDLDASRTAVMGGSFGGYMANWIAGHTDRFRAIVSHAGLWSLEQFHGTTDLGPWWEHQLGDPYVDPSRYIANSPRGSIASVRTPMLVIHGLRDYRVPVAEALRLWTDLQRHGVPSQYLCFPDENHWILKPGNVGVWYETVLAFLAQHVLGEAWRRPELV